MLGLGAATVHVKEGHIEIINLMISKGANELGLWTTWCMSWRTHRNCKFNVCPKALIIGIGGLL